MTKPPSPKHSFGDLLRQILVFEKRQSLHGVATALSMAARDFCSRLRNGGRFDPQQIAIILRAITDERLPRWFFSGSGLLLVKHTIVSPDGTNLTLQQRTIASALEAIAAICSLADTLELCILGGPQRAMIEEHLDHAMAALLSIRLRVSPCPAAGDDTSNHDLPTEFPDLLKRVLLIDQGIGSHSLADTLNLSQRALHERMSGHVAFLPNELRQLFRMFPDPRVADYLLAGTAYTPILRPAVIERRIDGSPIRIGLASLREMVQFLEVLLLTEGAPGSALPATADRHLDEAVRQMATLQWNMTYIGHHGASSGHAAAMRDSAAA
jgi:hypothetical protein